MMLDVTINVNDPITVSEFIDVLYRSTLSDRRPVNNLECIAQMINHSNLIVTARNQGQIIGVARSLTDFGFCCYLSDLAVDVKFQSFGVGRKLIKATAEQLDPKCKIILLAAPKAVSYYPKIGFQKHDSAWIADSSNF